jgi:hypothetical protein
MLDRFEGHYVTDRRRMDCGLTSLEKMEQTSRALCWL